MIAKLVSGGQTGVDCAALDVALDLGIPVGGWCPKGRKAEDDRIPERYPLTETTGAAYSTRTRWNVRDSDFTLVLTEGEPSGRTLLTVREAERQGRPHAVVDLTDAARLTGALARMRGLLAGVRVLNMAGPRESGHPGVYAKAKAFLRRLLADS